MKFVLFVLFLFFGALQFLGAFEIPLDRSAAPGGEASVKFAVVDMTAVLNSFPETKKRENEMKSKIDEMEAKLTDKQNEIEKLQIEIGNMEKLLEEQNAAPQPAMDGFVVLGASSTENGMVRDEETGTGDEEPADSIKPEDILKTGGKDEPQEKVVDEKALKNKNDELEKKTQEFKDAKAETLRQEEILRQSIVQTVMGKVYAVLEEIAKEEGVQIIVDKNNVLYGRTDIDLTQKLINRLTGVR